MKHDEFVAKVRDLAELENNQRAEKAVRATLETLRERLTGNEPSNLADRLPEEFADAVRGAVRVEALYNGKPAARSVYQPSLTISLEHGPESG